MASVKLYFHSVDTDKLKFVLRKQRIIVPLYLNIVGSKTNENVRDMLAFEVELQRQSILVQQSTI